ncbi:winged helix-turn-helix domain-containing protein [Achromobacter xylosoxidans]
MNMPSMSSASSGTPASARRQEASLDLPVDPPRDGESKQAWVYRQIRERVLKGALPSGARLPSTRSLAQRWRIARSTVEAAYDQLRGEGYTTGTVGSGTYVAVVIPDNFFRKGLPGESGASLGADARDKTGKAALAPARLDGARRARCRMSSR